MTTRTSTAIESPVEFLNPAGLNQNPAFSNVAVVSGSVRTIYVGGQDATDAEGNIVGIGDIAAQTEQVLLNLRTSSSRWTRLRSFLPDSTGSSVRAS